MTIQGEPTTHSPRRPPRRTPAKVDIHKAVAGLLAVLEVDAPRDTDVTFTVESTLFDLRVQVVRVRSQQTGQRSVHQYEVVEFDGAPLRGHRQLEVQAELRARLLGS